MASLEVTGNHLRELNSDGSLAVKISLDEVRRVTFANGFTSERPIFEALVGAALIAALASMTPWFTTQAGVSRGSVRALLMMLFLGAFAVIALRSAVRRGPYLRVETKTGVRKIRMHKNDNAAALRQALLDAGATITEIG